MKFLKTNFSGVISTACKYDALEKWRNSLTGGLKYRFKDTNIILQGGVDDL